MISIYVSILFPKQCLHYGVLAEFNLVPWISKSWPRQAHLRRIPCSWLLLAAQIYFFNELLPPEGDFSAQIYFFNELLPPEGDFSAQIYFFHELLPPEGD